MRAQAPVARHRGQSCRLLSILVVGLRARRGPPLIILILAAAHALHCLPNGTFRVTYFH